MTSVLADLCRTAKPGISFEPNGPEFVRAAYPDNDVRGLELRVAASGEKTWSFRYRDKITGKQSRVTLGTFDPNSDSEPDETGVRALTLSGARRTKRAHGRSPIRS